MRHIPAELERKVRQHDNDIAKIYAKLSSSFVKILRRLPDAS